VILDEIDMIGLLPAQGFIDLAPGGGLWPSL
jgi:predicted methyltransferase